MGFAVGRSPVRRTLDSPSSSPLLSSTPSPSLSAGGRQHSSPPPAIPPLPPLAPPQHGLPGSLSSDGPAHAGGGPADEAARGRNEEQGVEGSGASLLLGGGGGDEPLAPSVPLTTPLLSGLLSSALPTSCSASHATQNEPSAANSASTCTTPDDAPSSPVTAASAAERSPPSPLRLSVEASAARPLAQASPTLPAGSPSEPLDLRGLDLGPSAARGGDGGDSGAASSSAPSPVASPPHTPKKDAPPKKLRIGIGCRDGRSISVAIATHLAATLSTRGLQATARHRELDRQRRRERAAEQQPAPSSAQPPPAAAAGEAEAEGETGDVPADAAQAGVKALFANNQAA